MIYKLCAHVGCIETVPLSQVYCEKHKEDAEAQKQFSRSKYESIRRTRDAKIIAFYNSPEWLMTQKFILNKYKGLCLWDYFIEHQISQGEIVHHIIPIRDNWDRRLDSKILIPVSHTNHNMIEAVYRKNEQEKDKMQRKLFELLVFWAKKYDRG